VVKRPCVMLQLHTSLVVVWLYCLEPRSVLRFMYKSGA
jgi:hypothetical protein